MNRESRKKVLDDPARWLTKFAMRLHPLPQENDMLYLMMLAGMLDGAVKDRGRLQTIERKLDEALNAWVLTQVDLAVAKEKP